MKQIKISRANNESSCSSSLFVRLPDEMVLQILNKLTDLKTLCICKLISKRFASIVFQVDTISVIASSDLNWKISDGVTHPVNRDFFWSAVKFLKKFSKLKSFSIHLPSIKAGGVGITDDCLFKWKIQFGNRIESFLFLSSNSIYDTNANANANEGLLNDDEEDDKYKIALSCLLDACVRLLLFGLLLDFRLLEYVKISDSDKRGTVSVISRGKVSQVMNWMRPPYESVVERVNLFKGPHRVSECYVPLLKLPVSGYVMKGVTMILIERDDLPNNRCMNIDGFEQDKEEAVYSEAVMEIFKKHQGLIERLR